MRRIFLFLVFIFAASNNATSLGQNSISQSTEGNASPAINAGGDVIYTYNNVAEMTKVLLEFLHRRQQSDTFNEEDLKDELSIIHQELYETQPEEAEKRAAHFLETLPLHQRQIILSQYQDSQVLKNKSVNLTETFDSLIKYIDIYVSEIAVKSNLFSLEKVAEIQTVIQHDNAAQNKTLVRKIKVSDSKSIQVCFMPGSIVDDEFSSFPELSIVVKSDKEKPIKNGRLKIWGNVGDGTLMKPDWVLITSSDGTMPESTKKLFQDKLDLLLNAAIAAN